jgi:hypothetical protein
MKRFRWLTGLAVLFAACGGSAPADKAAEAPAAAAAGPARQAYGTLAEVMRAIPFTASNIIFDAQTNDPGAPKQHSGGDSATEKFAAIYGGWQQVENSARALQETANLIMIPGRLCENGLPVPLNQPDYQKAAQMLVDAGAAAYKAAKAKNIDEVIEVSNAVAEACAACHEPYRDVSEGKMRCVPASAAQ